MAAKTTVLHIKNFGKGSMCGLSDNVILLNQETQPLLMTTYRKHICVKCLRVHDRRDKMRLTMEDVLRYEQILEETGTLSFSGVNGVRVQIDHIDEDMWDVRVIRRGRASRVKYSGTAIGAIEAIL